MIINNNHNDIKKTYNALVLTMSWIIDRIFVDGQLYHELVPSDNKCVYTFLDMNPGQQYQISVQVSITCHVWTTCYVWTTCNVRTIYNVWTTCIMFGQHAMSRQHVTP